MSTSPLSFTGVSSFSSDFQTILTRAKSIASLPITAMQNDQKALLDKKTATADVRTAVSSLWSSLQTISKLSSGGALTASSSSTSVTAAAGSGAVAGTYQISDITSLASAALSTSTTGFATASSTQVSTGDHTLQLVFGSETKTLTLTESTDNLNGVRDAINAAGLGVTASLIDTGVSGSSRYYLSISASAPGAKAIELRTTVDDSGTNLMSVTNAGSDAQFKLNGKDVTSSDNLVTGAIAGVSLQLNNKTSSGETITVTVATDRTPIQNALQSLVTSYNALATKLNAQTGSSGGALQGDSAILGLSGLMRGLTSYEGTGAITNLAELGIEMSSTGEMSLDTTKLEWMSTGDVSNALSFLGTETTGFGSLASKFYEYSDPLSGLLRGKIDSYTEADSRLSTQIDAINERITSMQATLSAKLQAADALLASLDSQKSMLTSVLDSLDTVTNGKRSS